MSKTISAALKAHIQGPNATLATLVKLPLDGTTYYYTDHDKPIEYDGNTYLPYTGYIPSAYNTNTNMAVDNMTIRGSLDPAYIDENDILAGRYDFSEVEIFFVNYQDPDGMGPLDIISGKFGDCSIQDYEFEIEVRGAAQLLAQKMGETYNVECPASLGDSRCTVNLATASFTKTLTVGAVDSGSPKRIFTTNISGDPDDYFTGGYVEWLTGNNAPQKMDIKKWTENSPGFGIVELYEQMPEDIVVGNTATIVVGCDKTWQTCKTKFSNQLNCRGFPYLTGKSGLLQGPP